MYGLISGLPLILSLCVFDSAAAPIPFNSTYKFPFTHQPTDNISTLCATPPLSSHSAIDGRRYPRALSNPVDELEPIPNAFFPKYGIVLLALFIVICALSSALIIITLHSRTTRGWIRNVPSRVHARLTGRHQSSEVQENNCILPRGNRRENKRGDPPSNISSANYDSSSPYNNLPEPKDKAKATSSEETVTTIPAIPFSVSVYETSSSGQNRLAPSGVAQSPHNSTRSRPLSPPFSPLLDHLQTLLSTSKRMFQFLTAGPTSPSPTSQASSPNIRVAVDVSTLTPVVSEVFVHASSEKDTNLDSADIIETGCDIGCQDIALISSPEVSLTITTQENPPPQSDHSTTHSSPSIHSNSGFYSLSGDAQLSASTAFHSFIDLSMPVAPRDTHSDALLANPSDDEEMVISLMSPRYIPGIQLETIDEESDGQISSLTSALSASVARDTSSSKWTSTKCSDRGNAILSSRSQNTPTSVHIADPETQRDSQFDLTAFNEHMPNSWSEVADEPFSPPRFFPAARPPPPPSEPSLNSTAQFGSALRSPEKQDKHHSVAWLQPVIDWAVDHPRDDRDCDLGPSDLEILENIPDMESDTECPAALHAADAMAAVMDSLAAVGLDPTDMGLLTGAVPSKLSNFTFHSTSPSLAFADSETFRANLYARAAAADRIEEEEVENEIGISVEYNTPQKPHQIDVSSREGYLTSMEVQHNRSLSQSRKQGESIKTALISLLSPISTHINSGDTQPGAHRGLSEGLTSAGRCSQTETKTHRRDSGQEKFNCAGMQDMNEDPKKSAAPTRARSPTTSRSIARTPRTMQNDRVYASPSSLAGLSPLEVAKKLSSTASVSSAGSTPSPSGIRAASPPHRPSSVSPLQLRKTKGVSISPSLDLTASALTGFPHHDPVSPSPRSRTLVSHRQPWQDRDPSALGSTKSTPMLSLRHDTGGFLPQFGSSPISPLQSLKPLSVPALARPAPVLIERTNSMEFESV